MRVTGLATVMFMMLLQQATAVLSRLPASGVRGLGPLDNSVGGSSSPPVSLQGQETFYIGDDSNPSNPLVQLNGRANSSNTQLLSTERFANVVKTMSCTGNSVSVQFANAADFQAAQTAWGWVNQDPSNLIILVTGGSDCSTTPSSNGNAATPQQYESYGVSQVSFDQGSLTATCTGTNAPLGQLLDGNWSLVGSSTGIARPALQRRFGGNVDLAEQVHIPNIFDKKVAGPVSVSLDGTLSSQGSLQWDIEVDGLKLSEASVKIQTTGVSFTLTPQLSISGAIQAISAANIDLPEIPLGSPSGPFNTKIGLFLVVGAQADLGQVSAEIDASIDLTLALSDGTFDLTGGSSPSVTGFSPSFSADNPVINGQVTLQSSIGPTVALVLQASVFGEGVEGGIQLAGPEADLTLTAEADSSGVCGGDQTLGVDLDVGVGVQLDGIFAFGNLDSASTSSLNIYSTSAAIFSTCIAGGPTVGGGDSSTTAAPLPASSTPAPSTSTAEPSESSSPPPGANPINGLPPAASTGLNPVNGLPPAAPTPSTATVGDNPVNGLPPAATTGLNPVNGLPPAAPTTLVTTTAPAASPGVNPLNGLPPAVWR